jgi:DNA-directed RNA polymerase subunit RPC12/RpoP
MVEETPKPKFLVVCNCGNTFEYDISITETKTVNCSRCSKPITIKNYVNRLEVIYG